MDALSDPQFYAERIRRPGTLAERRSVFVGMVEALADDHFPPSEQTVEHLRAAVAGLRLVEGRER